MSETRPPQWELEMILDVEERWSITGEEAEMFLERVGAFGSKDDWVVGE